MKYSKAFLLFFLTLFTYNISSAQNGIDKSFGAGEYEFDTIDGFKICQEKKLAYQYYNFKYKYPMDIDSCISMLNDKFTTKLNLNGIITTRFIVNCEGRIGFFKVYQLNDLYEKIEFPNRYVDAILNFVKSLKDWTPLKGRKKDGNEIGLDYYAYFSFKIINGKIYEIIP